MLYLSHHNGRSWGKIRFSASFPFYIRRYMGKKIDHVMSEGIRTISVSRYFFMTSLTQLSLVHLYPDSSRNNSVLKTLPNGSYTIWHPRNVKISPLVIVFLLLQLEIPFPAVFENLPNIFTRQEKEKPDPVIILFTCLDLVLFLSVISWTWV